LAVCWILVYGSSVFAKRREAEGKPLQLRRLPGFDAIDEGVGRCAEMGRPLYHLPGAYTTASRAWITVALAGLDCMSYIAEQAASKGVEFRIGAMTEDLLPLMAEITQEAYQKAGIPEEFDAVEQVQYIGTKQSARVTIPGFVLRGNPAFVTCIGSYASDFVYSAESAKRVGALLISGDARMYAQANMAIMSDYFLCGEEIYAAAAYATGDVNSLGTIIGQDFSKIFCLGLMALLFILNSIGFTSLVNTIINT
jgi:hypothetical protein